MGIGYEPNESASIDELRHVQIDRLQTSVRYGYDNVAHYRASFDRAGVHPDDIKTLDDLASDGAEALGCTVVPVSGGRQQASSVCEGQHRSQRGGPGGRSRRDPSVTRQSNPRHRPHSRCLRQPLGYCRRGSIPQDLARNPTSLGNAVPMTFDVHHNNAHRRKASKAADYGEGTNAFQTRRDATSQGL